MVSSALAAASSAAAASLASASSDRAAAWADYLRLCRAGGTRGYFELLETGKLLNPFRDGTVAASVGHVIEEIRQRY